MGIIDKVKGNSKEDPKSEKSVYVKDVRIDKAGKTWQRKAVWIREEYLGKLKVIAHFEDKPVQEIVDRALGFYLSEKWDKTGAMKKMIDKSKKKS